MRTRMFLLSSLGAVVVLSSAAAAEGPGLHGGAVFTMTDDATANAVLAFSRAADGSLAFVGSYPTGGAGSGGGEGVLGSQGALALGQDGRFLFAVNAGSDEVSSFRVEGSRLVLAGVAPSGGQLPVSVTEHDGIVYVLNAGGTGSISGLTVDGKGRLAPLPGSTRPLSSGTSGAAQVVFDSIRRRPRRDREGGRCHRPVRGRRGRTRRGAEHHPLVGQHALRVRVHAA